MPFDMTDQTPDKEVERTYKVALTGDLVVTVRLRYTPGEEPADRTGDTARNEAIKRAITIRAKKGDTRSFDPGDAGIEILRESLVDARPVNLDALATKFRRPDQPRQKRKHASATVGNGWDK
jgi:hypothetical protein